MTGVLTAHNCHGMCFFRTFRGLEAFGNGRLGQISHSTSVVEFRDAKLGGVDYLSSNTPTLFLRKFFYVTRPAYLLGVVSRRRDAEGRDGFQGVGVMIDDQTPVPLAIKEYLLGFWQDTIEQFDSLAESSFESVFWEPIDKPARALSPAHSKSLILSNGSKSISAEHLGLLKELVEANGSHLSTVFLQLDPMLSNMGPLSRESVDLVLKQIELRNEQQRARKEAASQADMAHIAKLFDERTEALGKYRPPGTTPEQELYMVKVAQYVLKKSREKTKEPAK